MNKYIKLLYNLNFKALEHGDVPVSAIIIKDDKVIAKGYNRREKENNPLLHAEIVAIQKAARKLSTWNLNDCTLICSLKPCDMCSEVIKNAKIKKVYYLLENEKVVNNKIIYEKIESDYNILFYDQLKNFFIDKR